MRRWIAAAGLAALVVGLLVWQWSREQRIEACVGDGGVWNGPQSRCDAPSNRPILKRGIERSSI